MVMWYCLMCVVQCELVTSGASPPPLKRRGLRPLRCPAISDIDCECVMPWVSRSVSVSWGSHFFASLTCSYGHVPLVGPALARDGQPSAVLAHGSGPRSLRIARTPAHVLCALRAARFAGGQLVMRVPTLSVDHSGRRQSVEGFGVAFAHPASLCHHESLCDG